MACNCITMVRLPDQETLNGKYPMPAHSPMCEEFKQKEYIRMVCKEIDASFIVEPQDVDAIEEMDGIEYKKEVVLLTADQYENLEEFEG